MPPIWCFLPKTWLFQLLGIDQIQLHSFNVENSATLCRCWPRLFLPWISSCCWHGLWKSEGIHAHFPKRRTCKKISSGGCSKYWARPALPSVISWKSMLCYVLIYDLIESYLLSPLAFRKWNNLQSDFTHQTCLGRLRRMRRALSMNGTAFHASEIGKQQKKRSGGTHTGTASTSHLLWCHWDSLLILYFSAE